MDSPRPFIHDNFLLHSETARALYHGHAAPEPVFDYHCHLPPDQIATNHQFPDLQAIWLAGDHYKWRAMRTNGVAERFCTGGASPFEKFLAFARTVPATLRNPLYHWTHLELTRYFGINELLNERSAERVWHTANERLALPEMSVHGLLNASRVAVVCTTDDPADSLDNHKTIRADQISGSSALQTRVYPTFRPDKALRVDDPVLWNPWTDKLASTANIEIGEDFGKFLDALRQRHDDFHALGGRLSDHGLAVVLADPCPEAEARKIFQSARAGHPAAPADAARFGAFLMVFFGHLDAAKGWTKQLHLGALRNNSTRLFRALGPDTGFDSIGDTPQAAALARYLDLLDSTDQLPKTIIYNLNPADNYAFATMIGNFQDGTIPGKIQFGSGWWFLDQKEGMEMQINALSACGLLRRFVGMLTDSRSFLSYPRHEYFRRILSALLARGMESGELPDDLELVGGLLRNVCYSNAENYFGLETGTF